MFFFQRVVLELKCKQVYIYRILMVLKLTSKVKIIFFLWFGVVYFSLLGTILF